MFKSITFALAFAVAMIVSPHSKDQKEILPVVDIAVADILPCPEAIVLVTIKPIEVVTVKVKHKPKKKLQKEQPKKKHLAAPKHHKSKAPHHHKSIPSHGSHGPTKIPTSHAPPHLTSPPGCG